MQRICGTRGASRLRNKLIGSPSVSLCLSFPMCMMWATNSPNAKGNAGGATFSRKVLVPGRAAIHVYEIEAANAAEVQVRQGAPLAAQKCTRRRSHQPRARASPPLPMKETPRCCPRAVGGQQKALQRDTQLPVCSAYQRRDREVF